LSCVFLKFIADCVVTTNTRGFSHMVNVWFYHNYERDIIYYLLDRHPCDADWAESGT
jgi:hypothetical protein